MIFWAWRIWINLITSESCSPGIVFTYPFIGVNPNDAGTILVNGIDEVAVEAVGVAGNMPVMDKLPGFMVEEVEPSPVGADP